MSEEVEGEVVPKTENSILHTTREQVQKADEAITKTEVEVDANNDNTENRIQTHSSKGSLDNQSNANLWEKIQNQVNLFAQMEMIQQPLE